ncbi:hypothetical protein ARMGADRAFT_1086667 [Armillaria gallica]|uniref:Uncharacterized protein n=1 Tax=Armillaria gallica TaxID=47427 RepID=A0A2H3CSZ6_ARMGA|nr:hypothetical protein ARMGADRAFT_1086667 [Armillaria gallica]
MSQVLVKVCIYALALARASTAGLYTTCSVGTAGIIDSTRIDSSIQHRVFEYIEGMLQDIRRTYPDQFDPPPITELTHRQWYDWGADVYGSTMMPDPDDASSTPTYTIRFLSSLNPRAPSTWSCQEAFLICYEHRPTFVCEAMNPAQKRRMVLSLIRFLPASPLHDSQSLATLLIDGLSLARP